MSNVHQGLYPIIRRVRRPLIATDAGTTATAVVPVQPAATVPASKPTKTETKKDAAAPKAND